MREPLPLKQGIIYGPVLSRRLGRSLGINLLPAGRKWCTFDCLYCQYGWTPAPTGRESGPLPSVEDVSSALEAALRKIDPLPDCLTFSGNGEPTLHPDFSLMVEAVRSLRDRLAPRARTALLSNSSRVGDPALRRAMRRLDRPIMKLDAGSKTMFRSFNRPEPGISFAAILSGLKETGGVTVQSLLAAGPGGNLGEAAISEWIERIREIRPRDVQVYTLSRPVPCRGIAPAPSAALCDFANRLSAGGIRAKVFLEEA